MFRVLLRDQVGRETVLTVTANTGNTASNRAVRRVESETGRRWYVVRCDEVGS